MNTDWATTEHQRLETSLRDSLTRIRHAWLTPLAQLKAAKPSASRNGRTQGRRSPVPPHISEARRTAAVAVYGWARVLIEDRQLHHARVRELDVPPMCDLLTRHATWLAHHPAAHDITNELHHAAHQLEQATHPNTRDTYRIGTCPIRHDTNDPPCGGEVRARTDEWGTATARCRRCGIDATLPWWQQRIEPEPLVTVRQLVDALVVAEGIDITERTIRHLIDTGTLHTVGVDTGGRRILHRETAVNVMRERTSHQRTTPV